MTEDRLNRLLEKQADNSITPIEKKELEAYLTTRWLIDEEHPDIDWEKIYATRIKPKGKVRRIRYFWASAAAVILAFGVALYIHHDREQAIQESDLQTNFLLDNIEGAKNGAILHVNSGKQFDLDEQPLTDVLSLIKDNVEEVRSLTITTSKANKYNFTLPDDSKIWLNANSQVSFPEHFVGNERRIITEGEVYLEVVKNEKPFIISTNGIETKVLGTSLNINGYSPNKTFTTLFTGKVAVNNGNTSLELTPGQAVSATEEQLQRYTPNLEKTISWKNNIFYFDNEDIRTILAELERWYDVQFVFQGSTSSPKLYSGVIDRSLSLHQTLEILNFSTSYKLTISDNNTIYVQKIQ